MNEIQYTSIKIIIQRLVLLFGLGSIVMMSLMISRAEGATFRVDDFSWFTNPDTPRRSFGMPTGTNLKEWNPDTGEYEIVEAGSHWHQGFVVYDGGAEVIGYAENHNRDGGIPNRVGQMYGGLLSSLGEGNKPDDVWTIYDADGDGWLFDTGTSSIILDEGDAIYGSNDLLFGPKMTRGDVSQLPAYVSSGHIFLPEMAVCPNVIPEPSTMILLGNGLIVLIALRKKQ